MKTKIQLAAKLLLTSIFTLQMTTGLSQGSLTPPGAPAPTMKTLQQVEPRQPITAPATITTPGSYYLTTNATMANSHGITIAVSDVTLDLRGFTLTCNPAANWYGVYINPSSSGTVSNIVVRNGTLVSFASGIVVGDARNVVIEDNQVNHAVNRGIWFANECQGAVVRRNLLVDSGGIHLTAFSGDLISGVTIEGNTTSGPDGSVKFNAQDGGTIRHVTVRNNHFTTTSGTAMVVVKLGSGVVERFVFDSNHCFGNGTLGMILPANTQSLVVRNFFVNLTLSTLIATGNTVGPIISTSGTLGTSGADISPWANIQN